MYPWRVLIVDDVHPCLMEGLENLGLDYSYIPDCRPEDIGPQLSPYQGLIIRSKIKIDENILNLAPNLRFIGRAGAGLDLIDLNATNQRAIQVFAANEGNRVAVAEHVIGLLISLASNIKKSHVEATNGIFDREGNRGWELAGKTMGIIGYGHSGSALVQRLKNFEMTLLVHDKYKSGFEFESSLEKIKEEADILSLHIPATEETIGMIHDDFIQSFSKPFAFINTSRGSIAPLKPLVNGLKSGKLLGVCLDVLPNERIATWTEEETQDYVTLMGYRNTIITPHIAGWTFESYEKISLVLLEKIKKQLHELS